jgi:adenosylhomocysteine nucleosidase
MIAVTFALPAEGSDFVDRLDGVSREQREGVQLIRGSCHGTELVVLQTGVGREIAAKRLSLLLRDSIRPRLLISAGFAGALDNQLQVGDLFLAENFSDATLLTDARKALADLPVRVGPLTTENVVLDSAADRSQLAQRTGAAAVDMETSAIAKACAAAGVPLLSLRAITDTPALPFPVPPHVLFNISRQKTEFMPLFLHLLPRPMAISKLVAFAKRIAHARQNLTRGLDQVFAAKLG